MSRRTTKCLTWGEMRRSGSPLVDENGRRVGMIDFAEWVTLCGKADEDPSEACALDHRKPRPVGVCSACWKKFRTDMLAAETTPFPVDALLHPTGSCRCHGQGECEWCVSPSN